jgi:hypothetical protein
VTSHLQIVQPPGEAPAEPRRRRKGIPSAALSLTPDAAKHLRAAIRNVARARYGTLVKLARALGVNPNVLTRKRPPGAALAVALWRITGVSVEALLRPTLAAAPAPAPAQPEGGAA